MIDQFEQYLIDVVPFFIGIISSFIILSRMKLFCSSGKFFKTVDDETDGVRNGGFGSSDGKC
jgi:hypothetical protein